MCDKLIEKGYNAKASSINVATIATSAGSDSELTPQYVSSKEINMLTAFYN